MDKEILHFIENRKKQGISNEKIVNELVENGWKKNQAQKYIYFFKNASEEANSTDVEKIDKLERMESKNIWILRLAVFVSYTQPLTTYLDQNFGRTNTLLSLIEFWGVLFLIGIAAVMQSNRFRYINYLKIFTKLPLDELFGRVYFLLISIPISLLVFTYYSTFPIAYISGAVSFILFELIFYFRKKQFNHIREKITTNK